jgi:tryptophan-rich sensory protein
MDWMTWYESLAKPSWTPEPATIGTIWTILYPIIAISFGFVFVQAVRGRIPWIVALPFAVNLVANLVFTPIQFGLRSLPLASVDIVIVWGSILWMIAAIWSRHRWVAIAQVPYLVWVSIATVLQLSITVMNSS